MLDLKTIIHILVPLSLLSLNNAFETKSPNNPELEINHHLKWITNQTLYPIKFSIPIKNHMLNDSAVWDWIRQSDQQIVSKLPDILENYLVTETESRASMYILNYDNTTHNQLSSYEPRYITDEQNFRQKQRDIFTLAYLKKHYIKAEKTNDSIKVSCIADFLIPNTENEYSDVILRLMEKQASFKLAVNSVNFPNRQNFFRHQNKQQFRPSINRKPSEQLPTSPRPQPTQNEDTYDPNNSYEQINPFVNQQRDSNFFYEPNQQNQFFQQFERDFLQNIPYHNEPFDPFHSFPIYNHPNHFEHENFFHEQHLLDIINQKDELFDRYLSNLRHPQFQFEPEQISPFFQPSSRFDYDYHYFRFKRDSKREPEQSEPSEEDFDFDTERFSKVRLSLGPVIINKPFEKEEVVSCLLNLINYDDANIVYNSKIIKKIKTSETSEKKINNDKEKIGKELSDIGTIESTTRITLVEKKTTKSNVIQTSTLPNENQKISKKTHNGMMFFTDQPTFKPNFAKFDHYYNNASKNKISFLILSMLILAISKFIN